MVSTKMFLFESLKLETAVTLILLSTFIYIFNHLKLCIATAMHNLKWLKITDICLIWDQTLLNLDV